MEIAKIAAIGVIALFMKFLARNDVPDERTRQFALSPQRKTLIRLVALLRLLLLAGLFVLIPKFHLFSELVVEAITVGVFLSAGAQIAISIYLWRFDRSMARGTFLCVVALGVGYALICRYGD